MSEAENKKRAEADAERVRLLVEAARLAREKEEKETRRRAEEEVERVRMLMEEEKKRIDASKKPQPAPRTSAVAPVAAPRPVSGLASGTANNSPFVERKSPPQNRLRQSEEVGSSPLLNRGAPKRTSSAQHDLDNRATVLLSAPPRIVRTSGATTAGAVVSSSAARTSGVPPVNTTARSSSASVNALSDRATVLLPNPVRVSMAAPAIPAPVPPPALVAARSSQRSSERADPDSVIEAYDEIEPALIATPNQVSFLESEDISDMMEDELLATLEAQDDAIHEYY